MLGKDGHIDALVGNKAFRANEANSCRRKIVRSENNGAIFINKVPCGHEKKIYFKKAHLKQ